MRRYKNSIAAIENQPIWLRQSIVAKLAARDRYQRSLFDLAGEQGSTTLR